MIVLRFQIFTAKKPRLYQNFLFMITDTAYLYFVKRIVITMCAST